MCQTIEKQRSPKALGYNCGCGGCVCDTFIRRFISAKEEQERLEDYREQLEKELTGVEEYLQEHKGK